MRRDAVENRAKLIETAEEVFSQLGTDTSVDDIAEAAGVGPATVYRHFARKDDLIRAVLRSYFGRLLTGADKSLQAPADRCVHMFLLTVGHDLAAAPGLAHGLWGDLAPQDLVTDLEQRTAQLLERAQKAGTIAASVTVKDIATVVRALRGIVEPNSDAWRRHVALVVAGMRTGPEATGQNEAGSAANR